MTYNVEYSDSTKDSIPVYDNTLNNITSLRYPGRNFPNYGKHVADNFLQLLENFASENAPLNPIEGQLWYDNSSSNSYLKIYDGSNWQAASNINKSKTTPGTETQPGELWIDTTNNQLKIHNGIEWVLIGPSLSTQDGRTYGTVVDNVADTDGNEHAIVTLYIADIPVAIISKDTFTPNPVIIGYGQLSAGINLNSDEDTTKFFGGIKPVFNGTATTANALLVNGFTIPANNFLRSDITSTTDHPINIRHDSGITIGAESDFNVSYTTSAAKLYNSVSGSGIDLQTKNSNGLPSTILRVVGNKVGINPTNNVPQAELDVTGNVLISSSLTVSGNGTASIKTFGGLDVTKNAKIGGDLLVVGLTTVRSDLLPETTNLSSLGSSSNRWKSIYAKSLYVDELTAANVATASALKFTTNFSIDGHVTTSTDVAFNGSGGAKTFTTALNKTAITGQIETVVTNNTDMLLVYQDNSLKRMQRGTLLKGIIPPGAMLPYASATPPSGTDFLLCDGSEVDQYEFANLYTVISDKYGSASTGKFKLPNLKAIVTPTSVVPTVNYIIKT